MSELEFARCDCAHCGNHLEFPLELADTPADCPHESRLPPLKLYPEDRDAPHPTTSQLFRTFERLSNYAITQAGIPCETYHDELSETQLQVLSLLSIPQQEFWP